MALKLLSPGLVRVHWWRPGSAAADAADGAPGYVGQARKP